MVLPPGAAPPLAPLAPALAEPTARRLVTPPAAAPLTAGRRTTSYRRPLPRPPAPPPPEPGERAAPRRQPVRPAAGAPRPRPAAGQGPPPARAAPGRGRLPAGRPEGRCREARAGACGTPAGRLGTCPLTPRNRHQASSESVPEGRGRLLPSRRSRLGRSLPLPPGTTSHTRTRWCCCILERKEVSVAPPQEAAM